MVERQPRRFGSFIFCVILIKCVLWVNMSSVLKGVEMHFSFQFVLLLIGQTCYKTLWKTCCRASTGTNWHVTSRGTKWHYETGRPARTGWQTDFSRFLSWTRQSHDVTEWWAVTHAVGSRLRSNRPCSCIARWRGHTWLRSDTHRSDYTAAQNGHLGILSMWTTHTHTRTHNNKIKHIQY